MANRRDSRRAMHVRTDIALLRQQWRSGVETHAYRHHELDIRDRQGVLELISDLRPVVIVHAAAQPSHDRAAAIPFDDFDTNAVGTLNLIEAVRRSCPDSPFVHMSTNKVYGDRPNYLPLADIMPACERLGMSFIPYYPLANGVLTGKYGRDRVPTSGTRLVDQIDEATRAKILSERTFARIDALETYARDRGHTLIELAFAWLLAFPAVATVIAGVARPGQASSNANASGWQLSRQEADEVIGLDIDPPLVPFRAENLTYRKGDVLNGGLPAGVFDTIVNCSTTEHIGLSGRYGSEARTVFNSTQVPTSGNFTANFTYTVAGARAADGMAFVLQQQSATAVGGSQQDWWRKGSRPAIASRT